jgi:AraC family transcriptional regulator
MIANPSPSADRPRRPYGKDLAASFGGEEGPFMVTRAVQHAELAVTELLIDHPPGRIGDPIPRQDAYMVCCQLRDRDGIECWEDGRPFAMSPLRAGDTTIHHLERNPLAMIDCPLHTMMWFVPRAALNALADQLNAPHIDEVRFDPRVGVADDTIRQISLSMLPALRAPERLNRLFADHVSLALAAHVAQAYGDMRSQRRPAKGGLAPWQERRAKELLRADLAGATPLADVAAACGLSPDYFSRAFRKSTGMPPHAWLLQARVERAMTLLRQRDRSLSEIALACGFVDQSHFTRVFSARVGTPPGAWRSMAL